MVGELGLGDHLPPARRALHPPECGRRRSGPRRARDRRRDVHTEPGDRRGRAGDRGELGPRRGGGRGARDPRPLPRRAATGEVLERTAGPQGRRVPLAAGGRHVRGGGARRISSSGSASTTSSSRELGAPRGPLRAGLRRRRATSSGRSPAASCTCCSAGPSPRAVGAMDAPRRAARSTSLSGCRCSPTSTRASSERVASVFKERRFAQGETVIQQGSGAAAFFVIDSGEATVLVDGIEQRTMQAGDYFGEMALIDAGTRTATVIAATELVCSGVTFWDFQPARRGERRDRLEAAAVPDRDLPLRARGAARAELRLASPRGLRRRFNRRRQSLSERRPVTSANVPKPLLRGAGRRFARFSLPCFCALTGYSPAP